jgi:hypothetical protein
MWKSMFWTGEGVGSNDGRGGRCSQRCSERALQGLGTVMGEA